MVVIRVQGCVWEPWIDRESGMVAHTNNPTTERLRQEDRSLTDSRSAWPRVEGPVSKRKKSTKDREEAPSAQIMGPLGRG